MSINEDLSTLKLDLESLCTFILAESKTHHKDRYGNTRQVVRDEQGKFSGGDLEPNSNFRPDKVKQKTLKAVDRELKLIEGDPEKTNEFLVKRVGYIPYDMLTTPDPENQTIDSLQKFFARQGYKVVNGKHDPESGFQCLVIDNEMKNTRQIIFRGTSEPADFDDDLEGLPKNDTGRKQIKKYKAWIEAQIKEAEVSSKRTWLSSLLNKKPPRKTVSLAGHSLGGALAQLSANEYYDKVDEVTTYNSPGISAITAKEFNQKQVLNDHRVKVIHNMKHLDPVQSTGDKYIDGVVKYYQGPTLEFLNFINPHINMMSLNGELTSPPKRVLISRFVKGWEQRQEKIMAKPKVDTQFPVS